MSTKSAFGDWVSVGKNGTTKSHFELRDFKQKLEVAAISPLGTPIGGDCLRALEPRILLDAAGGETLAAALDSELMQLAQAKYAPIENTNTETVAFEKPQQKNNGYGIEADDCLCDLPEPVITQVAFVDPAVEDSEAIIQQFGSQVEIVILDANSDGAEQMAAFLSDQTGIDAVHIISHGAPGSLQLGSATLDLHSIQSNHADELAQIKNALSANADILIYGCNFGEGEVGANAIEALVQATGADIAASNDLTGAAELGGDWDLEVVSGEIETYAIAPTNWAGTLDLTITDVGVGGTAVTGAAVDALAQQILGTGVTINSASYTGGAQQAATFVTGAGASFGTNIMTFGDGAIFSTGTAASVAGPNNAGGFTINAPGVDGDADFDALAGNNTFDASFIEITFTPDVPAGASIGDTGRMTMEIVFGSDEYNEYVYGGVNDTLAVIVNGANQAVVPNGLAIGIDTINDAGTFNPTFGNPVNDPNPEHTAAGFESANPSLYVNNSTNAFNTQMDGFSITVPVTFDVIVGQQNTIKLGIADTGDFAFDSWMFVKADSAQTVIVAENDSVSTPTDVPFNIDVTANDYDLQGDPLTVTHILGQAVNPGDTITLASGVDVTVEANGTLTVSGDGTNPANDAFTYSISDGNGGTSTAFVNVNITGPNSAPVAVDDGPITVTNNVTQNIDVVGNDTDVDGQTLSVTHIVDPANPGSPVAISAGSPVTLASGTVVALLADGTLDVTPPIAGTGVQTFDYVITDGALSDQATVSLNVVNTPPVAQDDALSVNEDGPAINGDLFADNGNGVDSDANGQPIIVSDVNGVPANVNTQITLASGALLTVNDDGTYYYDPNGQFESLGNGDTATDSFTYTISDGNGGTSTATATVTINGANDAPVIDLDNDDSSGPTGPDFEDTYIENDPAISIVDTDFTLTDPDNDIVEMVVTITNGQIGDTLQFPSSMPGGITASVTPVSTLTAAGPLTLTLTGSSTTTTADWQALLPQITFLPSTNDVHNPDPSDRVITVDVSDSASVSAPLATATIHVVPENDAPALDLDDDNSGGVNAGNYAGTFTEDAGAVPIHSEKIITDLDHGNLQSGTVILTNPQADDQVIIDGVVVYDNGAITNASGTSNGVNYTVVLVAGSPTITFLGDHPIADYTDALESVSFNNTSEEPDTTDRVFNVVVSDGVDQSPVRTATISVVEVNDPPEIQDPNNPGVPAPAFSLPDLSNNDADVVTGNALSDLGQYFYDPDPSDTLSYTVTGLPTGLSFNPATGEVTGTVDSSASQGGPANDGIYTVTVDVFDGEDTTTTSFTWDISNPPPVVDTPLADQNMADNAVVSLTPSISDPDSDTLTYSATGLPTGLSINPTTGEISGTVDSNASQGGPANDGVYTVTITADDSEGGTVNDVVTFTVTNVPPVVDTPVPDQGANDGDIVSITPSISDPDGDPLTYSAAGLPTGLSINPTTGEISGTIDSSASQGGPANDGVYTVTITADDGNGGTVDDVFVYTVANPAPVVDTPVADQALNDDETVSITPSISDPDNDTLTYSVTGLPTGLSINPTTGEISGTIDNAASQGGPANDGVYTVTITADDGEGGTVDDVVTFTVTNPAPVVDTPVADQALLDDETVSITPSISDPDNDTLTYSVTGLPTGLSINPTTGEISGTIDNSASQGGPANDGVYTVTITADDGEGGTVDDVVTFTVTNPSPVVDTPVVDQALQDDETVSITPDISDPDNDTLTYSVTGLPTGLSINPTTGEISGTVDNSASQGGPANDGVYTVTITADDGEGGTVDDVVTFTVTNPPPVVDTPVADQTLQDNETVSITPDISDPDNDTLTYSVSGLPTGLSINPSTGEISGTVDPAASSGGPANDGVYTVTITADDGEGGTVDDVVTFTVTNPPPVVDTPLPDQSAEDNQAVSITPSISDPDGDTLTYTAAGLPTGLSINLTTGEISGTIDNSASQGGPANDGVYTITITADDGEGGTVDDVFELSVTNPAPVVDTPVADQALQDDETVSITPSISDPDNDTLTYSVSGLPTGLSINPTTGEISGTIDNSASQGGPANDGVYTVTITADDGEGGTVDDVVTFTVTNPTPVVGTPVADQALLDDETVSITPSVSDPDGDTLTYSATGLPTGLSINPTTGEISGTVDNSASQGGPANDGVYTVTITADDGEGGTVDDVVTFTVTNPIPVVDTPLADQNLLDSDAVSLTPSISDPDNDTLTYSATGLPTGLSINPTTGEISGTIDAAASQGGPANDGIYTVTVTADDGEGGTVDDVVTFTVTNPAPVVDTPVPDQSIEDNETVSITPSISDPDGDTLTYTVTGLPTGLSINPATGEISGTVDNSASQGGPANDGVYTVTITADDGEGGTVDDVVTFTVTNPAPVVDTPVPDQSIEDNETVSITPSITDPDNDTLTYSATGLPTGLSINPATGEISGTVDNSASQGGPANDGVYTVTITADDGEGGTVDDVVTFTITNPPPVVVTPLPELSDTVGYTVSYPTAASFEDPDGDTLTFSAAGLPTGLTIDPTTGEISGTLAPTALGDAPSSDGIYTVVVTVDDGEGGTISSSFTYTVYPLPHIDVPPPSDPIDPSSPVTPSDPSGQNLILTKALNEISPLANPTALDSKGYPITQVVNAISPLGSLTSLASSDYPISSVVAWIEHSRSLLQNGSFENGSGQHAYLGGDSITADGNTTVRTIVNGQTVLLEFSGAIFNRDGFSISTSNDQLPTWAYRADDGVLIALRPADQQSVRFTLASTDDDGNTVETVFLVDLVTGQINIENLEQRASQSPTFSEQLASLDQSYLTSRLLL